MTGPLSDIHGNSARLSGASLMTVNAWPPNATESGPATSDWIKVMHLFYTPAPLRRSPLPPALAAMGLPPSEVPGNYPSEVPGEAPAEAPPAAPPEFPAEPPPESEPETPTEYPQGQQPPRTLTGEDSARPG